MKYVRCDDFKTTGRTKRMELNANDVLNASKYIAQTDITYTLSNVIRKLIPLAFKLRTGLTLDSASRATLIMYAVGKLSPDTKQKHVLDQEKTVGDALYEWSANHPEWKFVLEYTVGKSVSTLTTILED